MYICTYMDGWKQSITADVVFNEVLCFVFSHFENVPNDNISVVISNFYDDEELIK